jgi:enterochelin esterase family protein
VDRFRARGIDSGSQSRLRNILLSKGHEVYYQQFEGAHDYLSWRGALADGLILPMGVK